MPKLTEPVVPLPAMPPVSESNSSSVSVIDLTLTDEELLRLARAQARRRGVRAKRQRSRAQIEHAQFKRAQAEVFDLRKRRDELEQLLSKKEEELAALEGQEAPQEHVCSVCLQFEADRATIPCGHVALCTHCVRRLEAQAAPFGLFRCPICRDFVQKTLKLHYA